MVLMSLIATDILNTLHSNPVWQLDMKRVMTTITLNHESFIKYELRQQPTSRPLILRFVFQNVLDERGRAHMIDNIVEHLQQCTDQDIVRRSVAVFANVDDDLGRRLAEKLKIDIAKKVQFSFWTLKATLTNDFFYVIDIDNSNSQIEILENSFYQITKHEIY